MGIGDFIFGEDPSKVALDDPNLASLGRATETREQLRKRYEEQLAGGKTPGEEAISEAARTGAETLEESAKGRAAGTRGFARLSALGQVNRAANVGKQRILGQAATASGAQRSQDLRLAEQGLQGLSDADIKQMMLEEKLRKGRAKPGALGILGTLAGAGIGAAYGDPAGGAQFGGALGSGGQQFGQAWS